MKKIPFSVRTIIMAFYMGLIATLSLLPLKDLPNIPLFPGEDKLIHMSMYFIMAIVLLWGFLYKQINRWYIYGFIIVWGFSMEVIQLIMHVGRNFSMLDMLANIIGAFLGIMLFHYIESRTITKTNDVLH